MGMQVATLESDGAPRKVLLQAPKNGFFYVINRTNGKLISAEPFAKVTWASKIDLTTGRPVEMPGARYENGAQVELWPGPNGAHNWMRSEEHTSERQSLMRISYAVFGLKTKHTQTHHQASEQTH